MKLNTILKAIQEEGTDKVDSRRGLFKSFGSKVMLASLPLAAGSLFRTAKAQTAGELIEALNLVLTWEQFGEAFYTKVLNEGPVFGSVGARTAFELLLAQKQKHIAYLSAVIHDGGGVPATAPTFDITGGSGSGTGPFAESLVNFIKMLELAQTIEDTTIRVQKGTVTKLMVNDTFLAAVLSIHTATGRYAAKVRKMRKDAGVVGIRPWVTGSNSDTENSYLQSYYHGESITVQSGIDMIGLNAQDLKFDAVTQAFDEPMTKERAAEILDSFIDV
ncbi:ferritin-like domain-containing protein [Polluticoccus soli]|uniref:ferritin-like domain-containing protein n=1 Tax=Polluticoccus soli TaxID=3034150 RepID=UPI0023E2871F|nr:ferritin-like domain-containing protein [Flavipsychrobacter sp. JY13-12]